MLLPYFIACKENKAKFHLKFLGLFFFLKKERKKPYLIKDTSLILSNLIFNAYFLFVVLDISEKGSMRQIHAFNNTSLPQLSPKCKSQN